MRLTRRQKRILVRRAKRAAVKAFPALGAIAMAGAIGTMVWSGLNEPAEDWSAYIEENHIGMVEVSDGYWMKQEDYEQMCIERDAYKQEEADAEREFIEKVMSAGTDSTESTGYTSMVKSRDWDADEAYMMAKLAMAEAESESTECKALVILTVLNRVWGDNEFPDTIEEVIYQKRQFTPIWNGRYDRVEPDEDCWNALMMVEHGWDESEGCTYFELSTNLSTWHKENLQELFTVDNTTFYKEK